MLDTFSHELDEARAKIEATQVVLQAALGVQERSDADLAELVARLKRMANEMARIEAVMAAASRQSA